MTLTRPLLPLCSTNTVHILNESCALLLFKQSMNHKIKKKLCAELLHFLHTVVGGGLLHSVLQVHLLLHYYSYHA